MKFLSLSSGFLLTAWVAAQTPNESVLTFVDRPDANNVNVDFNVSGIGPSNDTSKISGTMTVRVNLSPASATTDELTILSADAGGSNVNLTAGNFFANYNINVNDIRFTITTPNPPGLVTPQTGKFEANQYQATTTAGTVSGTARIGTQSENPNFNLATDPFSGSGQGTGTITVTPGRIEGRRLYFDLTVELPLAITGSETVLESPVVVTADFDLDGTVEAAGETFLEFPDYAAWATTLNLAPDSQNENDLQPDTPNYLHYALGFDDTTAPARLFELSPAGATLNTGGEIALDNLEIQWSDDLVTWTRVPQNAMLTGSSQMSFGDSLVEPPSLQLTGDRKYLRLARPIAP